MKKKKKKFSHTVEKFWRIFSWGQNSFFCFFVELHLSACIMIMFYGSIHVVVYISCTPTQKK
jgi:hypothetical protein